MKKERAQHTDQARALRRDQTSAERLLWSRLRGRRIGGEKFRRQVPVGAYVADFASLEGRLLVELDGATHGGEAETRDAARTRKLEALGYVVIRFQNDEVYRNLDGVCDTILHHLHLIERGHRLDAE